MFFWEYLVLFLVGAVASAINTVAGGGSLVSFPVLLVGFGLPSKVANATNALGLWPGSLAGAYGFIDLLPKTGHHLKVLILPTFLGAALGSVLLIVTKQKVFDSIVPVLLFLATLILAFQPRIKKWAQGEHKKVSPLMGVALQFLVSVYGGYFGAGMGIMMLAAFALYIEGSLSEVNALKNWLGLIINLFASGIFLFAGLVEVGPAIAMALGAIVGGFWAAKASQKVDADKMRIAIVVYGFLAAGYFAYKSWAG